MSDEPVRSRHGGHGASTAAEGRHHGLRGGDARREHHAEDTSADARASLYFGGLDAVGRRRYELALAVKGLAQEIALLRLRIAEHADDPRRLEGLVTLLVKAVAVEHRLSQQHQDELYQSVLNVIQGLGEAAGLGAGDGG